MYQNEYRKMNDQINPDAALMGAVMEKAVPRKRVAFRPAVAVAMIAVMLLAATPVMAEHMPWILERIAPQLVEKLEPVQRKHTNNGITMEVVGASVRGNKAELVVRVEGEALKDPVGVAPHILTNRDGLSSGAFTAISDYEGVEADRANGIYYYQILMTYRQGLSLDEILAGELTVTLNIILLTSSEYSAAGIPITPMDSAQLSMIKMSELQEASYNSFGCENIKDCRNGCTLEHDVIAPCEDMVYAITEDVGISCITFIDRKLHIQMKTKTGSMYRESAYWAPYQVDADGNEKYGMNGYYYSRDDGTYQSGYSEHTFSISPEEMENYTIRIDYRYWIRPECQVTFRFTEDEVISE